MVSHQSAIIIIFAAVAFGLMFQAHKVLAIATEPGFPRNDLIRLSPVAVSGNNIYTAWDNDSATLHGSAIFFTKSNDGGKTFANTMVLKLS